MEKQDAVVSARVPLQLKQLVSKFIQKDTHLNESDLIRDALREKIRRDAPLLYEQLFRGGSDE
jgi:Arc/MetJ-type ribon-helix-helix transcriptional regulator